MRSLCAVLAAVSLPLLLAGDSPGQKGVVPRPPPPVRPPVRPPVVAPVVPPFHPVNNLPAGPKIHQLHPGTTTRLPDTTPSAILAAVTIALMASPDGDGTLLAATALVEHEMRRAQDPDSIASARSLLKDSAVLAAGTVGLMSAADGYAAMLASSALVGRETSRAPRPGPSVAPERHVAVPPAPATAWVGWVIAAVVGFGLLVVAIVAASRGAMAWRPRVCIIDVPPGEAPEQIRRAWVGLELPLAPGQTGPVPLATKGVVSGQQDGGMVAYVILGSEAVKLLAAHDPEAALWWRTHAPHVLAHGYQLAFPTEVCERA
jgi:hypothetical protein